MNVLILGGMRTFGRELAVESLRRGHETTVAGRTIMKAVVDPGLRGAQKIALDLLDLVDPAADPDDDPGLQFVTAAAECDVLFWVSGVWMREPFGTNDWGKIEELISVHLRAPLKLLLRVANMRIESRRPLHLVTIASSSAKKLRLDGQAVYGMVEAGKAQFARNLQAEGTATRSTVVYPGGMRTDLFAGSDVDTSAFADPSEVAEAIWSRVDLAERPPLLEMDVFQRDGRLVVDCTPHDPLCP